MRALVLAAHSHRPEARLRDGPTVAPAAGEIRVRIRASALNPLDAKIATGAKTDWFSAAFPYEPGTDFAGMVEALGASVADFAIGDEVFGRADPVKGGAIADCIVLDADRVARSPRTLSPAEAACLPTPAGVALQVLNALSRADDEPVLILGDGMVARMASALVGEAARRAADVAQIGSLDDIRYAIDTCGGALQDAALEKLPPGGRLVTLTAPADAAAAAARGVQTDFVVLETSRRQLEALASAADRGVLRPHVDHLVRLGDAASAFERYVARGLAGKIVIEPER